MARHAAAAYDEGMKKPALACAVLAAALILTGAGGPSSEKRPARRPLPPSASPQDAQRMDPRRAEPAEERATPDRSRPERRHQDLIPSKSENAGPRKTKAAAAAPPARQGAAARSTVGVRELNRLETVETTPNHYYWHTQDGAVYTHYYDGGDHWYGFYAGPSFYWTRYYGANWWWYDSYSTRWVYWDDGFWWWPGPGGVAYVYIYDGYHPYAHPDATTAAIERAAASEKGAATTSPDGKRTAKVFGPDGRAFLYDKAGAMLKPLGKGVSKVRFADGAIVVEFRNGSLALFDLDGNPLKPAVKAAASASPPPAPRSIPPPPTSAP